MIKVSLDTVYIDETKLDESFHDSPFHLENYHFPLFEEIFKRNLKGRGKLVFVNNALIAKRVKDFETKVSKTICLELTILNKKWCILFV